jgi:hypothetical protein
MAKVPLQGTSISQLSDGLTGKALDVAFNAVSRDIAERGDDGKPRTITLTITVTPIGQGMVEIDTQVATKTPALHPPKTNAKLSHAAGGLIFNPDCSENPDQRTFNDLERDGRDAA